MAQNISIQNTFPDTVDFSTIENGELFLLGSNLCVKLDNNNPNYTVIGTGAIGLLEDTDNVLLPAGVNISLVQGQ